MGIDGNTRLEPLLDMEGDLRDIIDWYGVDLTRDDRRSTLAEFCERYGLLLHDLRAARASDYT